ncbi:YkgJ family cysteine cluster protein [Rhodocyclus purpureus]|uniref:YkgJ family cysteine cluster protein n=1 Tax=Rhodocyclus purpureus TaxID=1067 RepID=UPI0030842EC9
MQANSRVPTSAQTGIHEQLAALLARRSGQPFRQPIADYNRRAFAEFVVARDRFSATAPLILDSCCGTGESSFALARAYPDHFVVGVDQSAIRLARGQRQEMPANLVLVRADLVDFWRLIAEAGIRPARHALYYPNPWPKIGHLARRWHAHAVFPTVLALGGILECRSNWRIYTEEFAFAVATLSGLPARSEPWLPDTPITAFERKYLESGHALYRVVVDLGDRRDLCNLDAQREKPIAAPVSLAACANPVGCAGCGACCASYRVDFHRAELDSSPGGFVPAALTVPLTKSLVRMLGTDAAEPRCIALEGEVGRDAHCGIYDKRPGPCREFGELAPFGIGDDACGRARRRHGLMPLGD